MQTSRFIVQETQKKDKGLKKEPSDEGKKQKFFPPAGQNPPPRR